MAEPNARISDDLRYELADSARVAESANRPRALVVLATVLFVIAGVVLVIALGRRETAAREYALQAERQVRVADLALQFERLEELRSATNTRANEPLEDLFSRIELAATELGLDKPRIPRPQATAIQGANKIRYSYTMQDASLNRLLAWVEAAKENVPGLEVSSLTLTPAARHWTMEVTFVRWERI